MFLVLLSLMGALERILPNNDWLTLLFLVIVFLLLIASLQDRVRLKHLFRLPFNNYYLLSYAKNNPSFYNILLFISSNLTTGIFLYILFKSLETNNDIAIILHFSFTKILIVILIYWSIVFTLGLLVAYLFETKKLYLRVISLKMSYFYSSNIYILILLFFSIFYYENHPYFVFIISVIYAILLLIRYYHFINQYKKEIFTHYFYFILYLCALEIAPLLIVYKIGF